ncbi:MAG: hypothetical protein H7Y86_03105 [Rhizobacter sp.]|nr:hypothetical protein [Ferruginibacter sp.]
MKLEYINEGRGGYVVYKDDKADLKCSFEFGGGNCVAIIFVPKAAHWLSQTKRELLEREAVLNFVGQQAVKDQAAGGHFVVSDNYIEIFSR